MSPRNELKTLENVLGGLKRADFRTARPPGSNPEPPTIFVFKSPISGVVRSRRITARSQFPAEHQNQGGVTVPVVGQREITALQSVATQRPKSTDAQGRTVRHWTQITSPEPRRAVELDREL